MTQKHNAWPAIRILHLSGGARAISEKNGNVKIYPNIERKAYTNIKIGSYAKIYSKLESLEIKILGVVFCCHSKHLTGEIPMEWRPYHRIKNQIWPAYEAEKKWREIANATFKKQNGLLWDISSRIAYQIRTVAWRLREISEAYHNQLNSIVERSAFTDGSQIMDSSTDFISMALHGFLIDICILKDYLAEFIAIVFDLNHTKNRITMMSKLINHIPRLSNNEPIIQQLKEATKTGGWIKTVSDYRNLIIHYAPLAIAQEKILSKCSILKFKEKNIPTIKYLLPSKPETVCKCRKEDSYFNNFSNMIERFSPSGEQPEEMLDGMDYAHSTLKKIAQLANDLANKSPIAPEKMVFEKPNIIGKIKFGYLKSI